MSNLIKLREWMNTTNVDAFVLSTADEYQNEFTPEYFKRLAWLTKFDGSTAYCAVLDNKAAIFVDGRYTLQATIQTDNTEWEVVKIDYLNEQPIADWLKLNLPVGSVVAMDFNLQTEPGVECFRDTLNECNIEVKDTIDNPIDALWNDKPKAIFDSVILLPDEACGQSIEEKTQRLLTRMKKNNLYCVLISSPEELAWVLNIRSTDVPHVPVLLSRAIVYENGTLSWFVDKDRLTSQQLKIMNNVVNILPTKSLVTELKKISQNLNIAIHPGRTSCRLMQAIRSTGANIVESFFIEEMKSVKNITELAGQKNAQFHDGLAMIRFIAWLKRQLAEHRVTEIEAGEKSTEFRAQSPDYLDTSFPPMSAAGENAAILHYQSSDKSNAVLNDSKTYLIDSGGHYRWGTTDITRTLAISEPTNEQIKGYTLVLKGHISLSKAKFPEQTPGLLLDSFARQHLWQEGMNYAHGTGHGIGAYLSVHEGPASISTRLISTPLVEGMLLTNEPGYYKEGEFGIRIENILAVKKAKEEGFLEFEEMTYVPMEPKLINFSLLTQAERIWLSDYHREIEEQYLPHLSNEDSDFLVSITSCFQI